MKAMRDELARSMQQLRLENLDKPYFIAYRVLETNTFQTAATFGALVSSDENHIRLLTVEVRVGSPKLDNTNFFFSLPFFMNTRLGGGIAGFIQLPLEDDYKVLRRQIWLATDGAYKKALEDLSRKRAALQNKTATEDIPDFTEESPTTSWEPKGVANLDLPRAETLVRNLSGVSKDTPAAYMDSARLSLSYAYTWYVNSEGTSVGKNSSAAGLTCVARTQADDGTPLNDFVEAHGRTLDDLASEPALLRRVQEMGESLQKLRAVPSLNHYNGPVLFEGRAAAELFSRVLAPYFAATRQPISDNPQFGMAFAQIGNPFQDKLGARILPDFVNVVDDPTLSDFRGERLLGGYQVDEDGVRAHKTALVENGVLKTLLATRDPVPGVTKSTGSRRGGSAIPSNLLVTVDHGLGDQALREKMLNLVKQRGKPYGIVIEQLANPLAAEPGEMMAYGMGFSMGFPGRQGTESRPADLAYKLFADGHQELIRNVEIEGVTPSSFKEILAASDHSTVYASAWLPSGTSIISFITSGGVPGLAAPPMVSYVVPSLLFEDVALKGPSGPIPKPPLSQRPLAGK